MTNNEPGNYSPNDYDPAHFYIGSVDKRGHGTAMRVPDHVHSQISAIINHEGFPYRSAQDFYRDAGVHRMHWLRQNSDDPALKKIIDGFIAQMEGERIIEMVERVGEIVRELPGRVKSMVDEGDLEAARAYLLRMSVYAKSLPDESGRKVTAVIGDTLRMYVMK